MRSFIDVPLHQLFEVSAHPAAGGLGDRRDRDRGCLARRDRAGHGPASCARPRACWRSSTRRPSTSRACTWAAESPGCGRPARSRLYAAALGILGLFVDRSGSTSIDEAWAWGHVATRGLVVGLAIVLVLAWPYTRIGRHLLIGSYGLVATALTLAVSFDLDRLDSPQRGWTVLITGSARSP